MLELGCLYIKDWCYTKRICIKFQRKFTNSIFHECLKSRNKNKQTNIYFFINLCPKKSFSELLYRQKTTYSSSSYLKINKNQTIAKLL